MLHDPLVVRMQIEKLLHDYPELAEDDAAIELALESETDAVEFLRSLERARRQAVAMAKANELIIDELKERIGRFNRRDEALRRLMFQILQAANLRKLELPEATLSIRNGVPKVIVTDEAAVPETFIRIKRELDISGIKGALKDGIPVPGATLSNADEILAIRTK